MRDLLDSKASKVKETPGKIIRAFPRNFSLTLKDMQRLTGIPQTNLSGIENDRVDIGVKHAMLIEAVFGVKPALILFPENFQREEETALRRIRKNAAALIERKQRRASGSL